jgi:hypothetical protein
MTVSAPTFDENGIQGIVLGGLTPGQRDKVMAQCLMALASGTGNIATSVDSINVKISEIDASLDYIATKVAKVDAAPDKRTAIAWLGQGTVDERPNTISVSSASLGLSYTLTFTYNGASPYSPTIIATT